MPRMPRRIAALAFAFALALAPIARGDGAPLTRRLASALAVPGNPKSTSSAVAIELATGNVLFARNADLSLEPASNEKLAITFAALRQLGPRYRFRTQLLATGAQQGTVWHGNVYLKGYGDPTLMPAKINQLAADF